MLPVSRLDYHYDKHGREMGAMTPEEYQGMANLLLQRSSLIGEPAKRGAKRYSDPTTGETLILSPEQRKILTYYVRRKYLEEPRKYLEEPTIERPVQ